MTSPFRTATTVTTIDLGDTEGTFAAVIDSTWTIGPKVHGGTLLATCAAAAKAQLADDDLQPLAVSASYLNAPDPGGVDLATIVRKRGKQVSHVDVELSQGGRVAVRAVVTLGRPDTDAPRHEVASSLASMPAEPPAETQAIGGDHPMASIVHLAQGCEMRIDPSSAHFLTGQQGEPEVRMWVRPRPDDEADVDTAVLFALMTGDICAPVTMNRGMFGWAPTVQLTAYLRRSPAPGWLRVAASSTVIGGTWFEEDHLVLDSTGAVVVQSRQLAMVPR
ncbi:thioesterase family protein [Rhodococcus sp. BP-252]|uniref:Diacylglycerol kinase n=1 Tax=Rhodococcoides kyotonense TaxID=398843 RepID=A0A177YD84_9NOCA|nr:MULTISPECIES: thioesterase family protein [Rhodococcus]MBY6413647.1 thioesterase family protein [Rhodococcus sp. BP-320]MBY6418366.1 thioesterase family protein [Rhodococcus sp. BP-321]MBY6422491.1 thioesterase family protein [Rhodococcus sp. BP-324]MBY6428311.1 thioesterase family protein [Rhodococcus sp. BP-323]MBY6433488.1 thioesterase family protein [Rhodococcus sp. BP-322]